ncbi:uncharacterized protein LOC121972232 [Zingiber officinale]|uniref:uncharacterized protein LOC121972232 n=1 Tax=Zingiber officinale TaxID=94328 RepID=UPI001C4AD4DD|nr:uncharacterized protein LOC121972232 [Zingiber officinale]
MKKLLRKRAREYHTDEDYVDKEFPEDPSSDDEKDEDSVKHGITRLLEGCRAFKVAFTKILMRNLPDDPLGPILSAHKKLVAEKLAEEDSEQKRKGATKKHKHFSDEKGHTKPDNFLDAKEKFLISVATKEVVKLFNAVRHRVHKVALILLVPKMQKFDSNKGNNNEPGWAPLHGSYMLTHSKLKG